ncbi:MAG: TIGR03905 family TSCPD domain-containing protein [Clostridia bacterium]|nr:TIGR03905 family TSCPD domain-containing protein [Clostridia bacterium]
MTKSTVYKTRGVCSREIRITLTDGVIDSAEFVGGCHGNTQGISKLVRGMRAEDVIERVKGTDCRGRGTSCPDQLAKALEEALKD